jgi:hypothetical protein
MPHESRHRNVALLSLALCLYISLAIDLIMRNAGALKNVQDDLLLHRIKQVVSGSHIDLCTPPTDWTTRAPLNAACPNLSENLLKLNGEIDSAYTERIGPAEGNSYRLWSETGSLRNCTVWRTDVLFDYEYRFPDRNNRGGDLMEVTSCEPVN